MICGDGIRVVHPLFQVEGGGANPTSPLQLHIGEINLETAIQLNALWHSRLPNVDKTNVQRTSNNVCYGAEHNGIYYAVAVWTDPIARLLNGRGWLELRRLAIADDAPRFTASRMLKVMRLMVAKKFPRVTKLISYQDTSVHAGTIYGAAGWTPVETMASGNNWDTPTRTRTRPTPEKIAPQKVRWEYPIRPDAPSAVNPRNAGSTLTRSLDEFADIA